MGDENQPSKKRAAGRELSRDNPGLDDEEDVPEEELRTFKKATDEVLSSRRIVKVRRQQTAAEPAPPSSNIFAGIRLVPPPVLAPTPANATSEAPTTEDKIGGEDPDNKDDETKSEAQVTSKVPEEKPAEAATESNEDEKTASSEKAVEEEKEANGSAFKASEAELADENQIEIDEAVNTDKKDDENPNANPLSSFQQHSNSQNAFTGFSGTGFSTSSFSFGSIPKDGLSFTPSTTSTNGSTPLFGTTGTSLGSMTEVPRETGEENEDTVFSADSALFEFDGAWKERGKGEVKVNVLKDESKKSRLVMRGKGNLRLILNASLYPDMKLTKMEKKGITFACVNIATEGKDGLATFALKFKDVAVVEEFSSAVSAHKGKSATNLKSSENSSEATDN